MGKHQCHIPFCRKSTPPSKLMCAGHWALVPEHLQKEVYASFQPNQCKDGGPRPSVRWLKAARYAVNSVTGKGVQWPEPITGYDEPAPGREGGGE